MQVAGAGRVGCCGSVGFAELQHCRMSPHVLLRKNAETLTRNQRLLLGSTEDNHVDNTRNSYIRCAG